LFSEREIGPELRFVVERWPGLSPEVRAAVVKIIQEHTFELQDRREIP